MTRRPHDALFKAAFEQPEHAGPMLRSVLPFAIAQAIAWDSLRPQPGSFIDPELADSHSDLLFSADLGGQPAYLYLLLEHQSAVDPDMPLRMLEYLVRIWKRHRKELLGPLPLIIPTVVSHAPGGWSAPASFAELFEPHPASIPALAELTPTFSILVDDLVHLDNDDIRDRALAAFQTLVLWVLRDGRDGHTLLSNLARWTAEFRAALVAPNGMEAIAQVLRYIALVSGDLHLDGFHAIIRKQLPEAEQAIMTIAEQLRREGLQQGIQRGLQQGIQRGLQQGIQRGQVRMLEQLLVGKFGDLSDEHRARIEAASEEQLDRFAARLLEANTIEAVLDTSSEAPRG